jgi:ABC-2 type transport system permease protein
LYIIRIYLVCLKFSLLKQIQYQAELLIWMIARVLQPVIYLAIWATVARANGGAVRGYTAGDFAAYFIAAMLVNYATYAAWMWEYEYRVRNGTLSALLLRPLHPIHADIAETIADKLVNALAILPTALLLWLVFAPTVHIAPWRALIFLPALLLAFALRFTVEWTLSMAAFWTTRVSALNQAYFVALLFLSGQMTPLALLPGPIQFAAQALPFRWVIAFPIELLLGRVPPGAILPGFAVQGAWLLVMLALLLFVWRRGTRRYSAVGA